MPTYRYFTVDVLTGTPAAELTQYGVTCNKQLSGVGSYSGFARLGAGTSAEDTALIDGTQPGLHALMVQRDGVNIWGGPIWSRTYAAQGQTVQLNASTFESVFDHLIMTNNQVYQGVAQHTILASWLTALMAQVGCNFNFVQDITFDGTFNRTILIPAYEYHFASDLLNQLTGAQNGIYYNIDLGASGDNPTRTFKARCGFDPTHYADSGAYYDYPGTIAKYWMNEQGIRTAKTNVALGAGTGNQLLAAGATNTGMTAYPAWAAVESFPDIGETVGLTAKAVSMAAARKPPIYNPTYQLNTASGFDGWNRLGELFTVRMQDVRFPNGLELQSRMTGWALTPQTKDGVEQIQFTLESDS